MAEFDMKAATGFPYFSRFSITVQAPKEEVVKIIRSIAEEGNILRAAINGVPESGAQFKGHLGEDRFKLLFCRAIASSRNSRIVLTGTVQAASDGATRIEGRFTLDPMTCAIWVAVVAVFSGVLTPPVVFFAIPGIALVGVAVVYSSFGSDANLALTKFTEQFRQL